MKRGTKHSTESDAGSQGVDGAGIYGQKKRRPPGKAAATKARGRGEPRPYKSMLGHLKVAATRGVELIGCGGAGGDWGGFADGVAVDDEFDAAIALAAFGGVVRGYGLSFAEAAGGH